MNDGIHGYECHPEYKFSLFVNTAGPNKENLFSVLDYEVYTHNYHPNTPTLFCLTTQNTLYTFPFINSTLFTLYINKFSYVPFVYCGGPNLLLKLPTFDNRSLN